MKFQLEWKCAPSERYREKIRGEHSCQSQLFKVIEKEPPPLTLKSSTDNICLNSPFFVLFQSFFNHYIFFYWSFCWYRLLLGLNFLTSQSKFDELEFKNSLQLQSFTECLRLALVFVWNSALREKFNFCFSRVFC